MHVEFVYNVVNLSSIYSEFTKCVSNWSTQNSDRYESQWGILKGATMSCPY
jgi:hypothetical protein